MTTRLASLYRLPDELKRRAQFALAGASKAPLSVDSNGKLFLVSVNRPSEWLSFELAIQYAEHFSNLVTTHTDKSGRVITQTGLNIGFILNEADPLACIDLDVKDKDDFPDKPELWTTKEQLDRYWSIAQTFDSYTELSRSGKGLHIWVYGSIGQGFKREGVEVYSQERFIICTGNVVIDKPVGEHQAFLANMVSQMRPQPKEFKLVEHEQEEDDWSVLTKAVNASNSEKFSGLWRGEWANMGFPSQSEADLALMSMLCFYSMSNSQCRRIFRDSALGKRDKAVKDDKYLNYTLTVIRDRQRRQEMVDVSAILASAKLVQELTAKEAETPPPAPQVPNPAPVAPLPPPSAPIIQQAAAELPPKPPIVGSESTLEWPPGFAGYIAQYIYRYSMRPVKEVAIVAALGLLAGICGKAWHIPQSGLNMYIVLIARSGVGKEGMHAGISSIIHACSKENPLFHKFIDFMQYSSAPALMKACAITPSFVNVSGEWGKKLARLGQEDGRDSALQTLRTQMTDLYQKSGPAAIVGGLGYSKTDENIASVSGVSYSMIGESTPGQFYKSLTDSMMEDGFLSRFLIIECEGDRPPENGDRIEGPDAPMVRALNSMSTQADLMISKGYSMPITWKADAEALMQDFNLQCDAEIRLTLDEGKRQMWNRAALKAKRICGLLAVADNWMAPCVTMEHARWAYMIVMRDIASMKRRLSGGDIGVDDSSRERKLVSVLKDYLAKPISNSYNVPDAMRQNGIVPRSYLHIRVNKTVAFSNHNLGSNRALDETLQMLINNGYLMEVQKTAIVESYNYHGKSYRVLKLPDYDEQ